MREVMQACLCDIGGWNVVAAASAQEGLEVLLVEEPDAILLDISMPDVDGWGFIQRARNNPLVRSIPVILISAKASWFTPQQLQQLGVAGAIAKPFNPLTLSSQVAALLNWSTD